MTRLHSSYLLRCWEVRAGIQRIEIEHIQTGEKVLLTSLDAAVNWLRGSCSGAPGDHDRKGEDSEQKSGG